MNEKYGIELEAKVNKFKAVMQATAKYVKDLAVDMKDAMTVTPKSTLYQGMGKEDLQKELEKQRQIASQMQENMNAKNIDTEGSVYKKSKQMYAEALVRISILKTKIRETNDEIEETNEKAEKSDNGLGKMFKKSISNIKRFSFYLLGARSVFSLFMKYQGIYHQYNEQMQYQTELSQNAIALSLGPAFEVLGNIISYVSIAFARFVELLTGVNVLSKVTTRGIRDYNKSLKETQTLVSGIDEITNLTTPQTTGLLGQYQALEDFRKKVAEVEKFFQENKWVKDLADGLKEVWKWIGKNTDKIPLLVTQLGTVYGALSLIGMTNPFIGLVTASASLVGNTISLIKNLKEYMRLKGIIEDNEKTSAQLNIDSMNEIIRILKTYPKESEEYKFALGNIKTLWDKINIGIQNGEEGYLNQIDDIIKIGDELELITGTDYNAEIEISLKENEENNSFWNKFKSSFRRNLNTMLNPFKNIFGNFNITGGYANGLDYVPYDNYPAILHKGEAVVPAKYNPAIHSAGNDYTNALLETLVTKMDDLATRPNVFEIDGQKFANATYSLYTNQEKRQNYNKSVVVR